LTGLPGKMGIIGQKGQKGDLVSLGVVSEIRSMPDCRGGEDGSEIKEAKVKRAGLDVKVIKALKASMELKEDQ